MEYFKNCYGIQAIKDEYRRLCFLHHPDLAGGDLRTMQDINNQYHARLKSKDGTEVKGKSKEGKEFKYTYRYDFTKESALTDMLYKVIGLQMPGVSVEIIGSWLWLSGETKPHAEALGRKGLGFSYSGPKQSWSWHEGPYRKRNGRVFSMGAIRQMFGSEEISVNPNQIGR